MKLPPLLCATLAFVFIAFPTVSSSQLFSGGKDSSAKAVAKARVYNLVAVRDAVPGAFIDMRYKVTSAAGRALYPDELPCLVHKATGQKLNQVQKNLEKHGYALKIWDAWRPPEAHLALWNAVKNPKYVVPPSKGLSWHCYGISVDLTLVKTDGTALAMPSNFDEFSAKASSTYVGGDAEIAKRVDLLQKEMRAAGFRTIRSEWWHFDDMQARNSIRRVSAKDIGIKVR